MPAEFGKIGKPHFAYLANRAPLLSYENRVLGEEPAGLQRRRVVSEVPCVCVRLMPWPSQDRCSDLLRA